MKKKKKRDHTGTKKIKAHSVVLYENGRTACAAEVELSPMGAIPRKSVSTMASVEYDVH